MRGMGKSAVTGARDLVVDAAQQQLFSADGKLILKKGELLTIDGSTGAVYRGKVPTVSCGQSSDFQTILHWADKYKNMMVLANADTPDEARKALELGAEGIGLCRTEHMFFGADRLSVFRRMLLSDSDSDRAQSLVELQSMQQSDFKEIFQIMHGRQVTVRLLDPPMHEFLPNPGSEGFGLEVQQLAQTLGMDEHVCHQRILALQEKNPMLGCRGCRLGIVHPEIVSMQTKAIVSELFSNAYCELTIYYRRINLLRRRRVTIKKVWCGSNVAAHDSNGI
jgi:pyruvate, orthophosphate dikinase